MIISNIIASLIFGAVGVTYDGLPISNGCVVSYSVTYNNNIATNNNIVNVTDNITFGFDVLDEGNNNYIYYLNWVDINGVRANLSEAYETTNLYFDASTYYVSTVGTIINYRTFYDLNDGDVYIEYNHTITRRSTDTFYGSFQSSRFEVNKVNLEEQIRTNFANSISGYNQGYNDGYNKGKTDGLDIGYSDGYSKGYTDGVDTDNTVFTIFNGILGVALLPINVFLAMLNFEVLGINISSFVMSLLTVMVTIFVIRTITGGKGGGSGD